MNDSRDQRTKLLAETLHGDWADGPAAAMARRAAAHARRRRALRSGSVAVAGAGVLVAVLFALRPPSARPPTTPTPVARASYEIISDEEFETLLRDRPLLVLPQENGAKKFVLLAR